MEIGDTGVIGPNSEAVKIFEQSQASEFSS